MVVVYSFRHTKTYTLRKENHCCYFYFVDNLPCSSFYKRDLVLHRTFLKAALPPVVGKCRLLWSKVFHETVPPVIQALLLLFIQFAIRSSWNNRKTTKSGSCLASKLTDLRH